MIKRAQFLFGGFYSGQFILLGVQLPFFSGWLALHGFSAPEIGWITGIALAARLALGPFVAFWADQQADERRALRLISALFAAGAIGLWLEPGKLMIAVSASLVLWTFGLLVPLSDSAVLRADRAGLLNYGQTRAVGSFAFLTTTILGGLFLARYGLSWSVVIMSVAGLATFLFSLTLPENHIPRESSSANWREAPRLISDHRFLLMVVAAGLTQGSHAVYYAFSILRWTEIGYSTTLIGFLWATGVIAEIFLLTRARGLARRFSPALMIGIGSLGAAIRWAITATEPSAAALFFVQVLHAFTFAATYLGTIEFIDRAIPGRLVNTAMTLMSTTGVGAITGLATIVAGYIFASYGAGAAYILMAAMGAIAMLFAYALAQKWNGDKLL